MERSVFISYSHADGGAVRRDAELLRASGVQVFIDVHDIGYGERWRDVLMQALAQCERVLVFWSHAAQLSEWVEREWRAALQLGKKIVPTLLDGTPLPAELAQFQAVTRFVRPAAGNALRFGVAALGVALAAGFGGWMLWPAAAPTHQSPPPMPMPTPAASAAQMNALHEQLPLPVLGGLALVAVVLLLWRWRRRAAASKTDDFVAAIFSA